MTDQEHTALEQLAVNDGDRTTRIDLDDERIEAHAIDGGVEVTVDGVTAHYSHYELIQILNQLQEEA